MKKRKNLFAIVISVFLVTTVNVDIAAMQRNSNNTEAEFKVSGLCGMCTTRIENAARSVRGVRSASYSLEEQKITVVFRSDRTNLEEIEKAIAKVGHDTENVKADDETYENLHHCCKYPRTL